MKFLLVILMSASLFFEGCIYTGERINGNGNVKTEKRSVQNAEKIKVTGDVDVIFESGTPSLRVEADENVLPYILTEMDNEWLEIGMKDNVNIHSENPMRVYITSPGLSYLTITGSGNFSAEKTISGNSPVVLDLTGSGNITMALSAPAVKAGITGSGNMKLTGEAKELNVKVTGSGDFKGIDLRAENVKANILGSGNVYVFVNASLDATIMGSGDVKYKGNASINKSISGSGSVNKVETLEK